MNSFGRLISLFLLSVLLLSCSSSSDERVYTAEELWLLVEWNYSGFDYIENKTSNNVTMTLDYPIGYPESKTFEIPPHSTISLKKKCYLKGESIYESISISFVIQNHESTISFSRTDESPWAQYFLVTNKKSDNDAFEIVEINGQKVKHTLINDYYFIDQAFIDIFDSNQ